MSLLPTMVVEVYEIGDFRGRDVEASSPDGCITDKKKQKT